MCCNADEQRELETPLELPEMRERVQLDLSSPARASSSEPSKKELGCIEARCLDGSKLELILLKRGSLLKLFQTTRTTKPVIRRAASENDCQCLCRHKGA